MTTDDTTALRAALADSQARIAALRAAIRQKDVALNMAYTHMKYLCRNERCEFIQAVQEALAAIPDADRLVMRERARDAVIEAARALIGAGMNEEDGSDESRKEYETAVSTTLDALGDAVAALEAASADGNGSAEGGTV